MAVRLLLRLMADYDISRYKIIHPQRVGREYGVSDTFITAGLSALVAAGILEIGPKGKIRGKRQLLNTYRIRPAMMLSPKEMLDWFRESREREERMALA